MITKDDMINPLLEISPDFRPVLNDLLEKNREFPIYLVLTELAKYISMLHQSNRIRELGNIFIIIEDWIAHGSTDIHEAVTSGLLEDLQDIKIVGSDVPQKLESYLLPETERWWEKILCSWLKWE